MLEILEGIDIRFKEPLKTYTHTKVGGRADYLVLTRNRYEMARVVQFANQENILMVALGMPAISLFVKVNPWFCHLV